jgi:hypothetical protein
MGRGAGCGKIGRPVPGNRALAEGQLKMIQSAMIML